MAATRLELWKDKRDEWRWSLYIGAGRDEVKVAVSPSSYASGGEARSAFMRVHDALRFENPEVRAVGTTIRDDTGGES